MGTTATLTAFTGEGFQSDARVRVAWKVKAIVSPDEPEVTCVVLDVSTGGARLSVPQGLHLPERFSLFLPLKNETHKVEIKWRDEVASEVGVAFLSPDRQIETSGQSHADALNVQLKSPVMATSAEERPQSDSRVRVAWKVKAVLGSGEPDITCVVVDVSTGGARLSVPPDTYLPDRFSLFLPLKNKTHDVEVRWRDSDMSEVGVAFLAPEEPIRATGQSLTDVRVARLEAYIQRLEEQIHRTDARVATLMERMARLEFPDPALS